MPPRRKRNIGPIPVESVKHKDKRINIPTADAQSFVDDEVAATQTLLYPRDTSLDPQMVWKGKDEQDSSDLQVKAPPIYIQEKIDSRLLIENLRHTSRNGDDEPALFGYEGFDGLEGFQTVEYYQHAANWSNRLILGDSLEVMASLAEREALRGKVQMIYLDPPYGISFNSNWQASTANRGVKDGRLEDATREVEQIKAFRDTWELGIHSYLSYLRDRLIVARDLLTESGSIFVQIGSQNLHLATCLLAEVFGPENHVETIAFRKKTMPLGGALLEGAYDYIVWFASNRDRVSYNALFQQKSIEGDSHWNLGVDQQGNIEQLSAEQIRTHSLIPDGVDPAQLISLYPVGPFETGIYDYEHDGRTYRLPPGKSWPSPRLGMDRLALSGRLVPYDKGRTLRYLLRFSDYPVTVFNNVWSDTSAATGMTYVVQTSPRVIQRCMLMATAPGDLVLDPTCGSGTTAYVAEQWGRRWITVDTSRVAVALARQRLMGAKLPYYLLADSPEGVAKEAELTKSIRKAGETRNDIRKGFIYERVPHVTLKSIANNADIQAGMSRDAIEQTIAKHADTELLHDRPYEDKKKVRVAGRFTVESLSPHRAASFDTEAPASERAASQDADSTSYEKTILDNLRTAGVQNGRKKERLEFSDLEPFGGRSIQAVGVRKEAEDGTPARIGIALGPEYGTVSSSMVKEAAREALKGQGFDLLLILGFAFDAQALETVEEFRPSDAADFASVASERRIGRLPVLLVRMNPDLAMGDELLKKTKAGNLFTVFGEPDITLERTDDGYVVEIRGVDVYDPTTGEVRSNDPDEIAVWMIDTDYNGESFFVRHCYFSGGGTDPYARLKKALKADIDETAWETLYSTRSRPFPPPQRWVAVKAINHYGDEVLKVIEVSA